MALQLPDFQRISFDEANPLLTGMGKGQQLMQSNIKFPADLQAAILANKLKGQQLEWNPQIWQSEIGLRGAQAGLANAEVPYYGAQTGLVQSQAGMNNLKLNYLRKILGGGQQSGGGGQSGAGADSGYSYDSSGQNVVASPAEVGQIAQGGNGSMQGGGQPSQQPAGGQQQQAPQGNSFYGVDVPQPSQSDIANSMLLGIDTFGPKRDNAKTQIQDQYTQYQKGIQDAIQEANAATNLNQAMSVFNNAMDRSTYKGSRLGHLPSSGWEASLVPGDLSPEQEADRSALQMMPAAIETLKDAMGSARFSNLDMNMATKMKFDRTMNDETRQLQSQWVGGVNNRMQEKAKFMQTMGNPRSGAMKSDADQLWTNYQQDFPLISKDGKTFQGSNLSNWPLYTTPKAIAAIRTKGTYTPTAAEKNVFMMQVPDGRGGYQIMPVKKGRVESAFRKGARPI